MMKAQKQLPKLLKEAPEGALEQLDDQELKLLYQGAPMELLLKPMKSNSRPYRKYIAQLGKLDRRSPNVKKKMIPFAVELYRNGNKSYQSLAKASLGSLLFAVEKGLAHNLSPDPADWKKLQGYNASTMADFLEKVFAFYRKDHYKITLEGFWLGLKILEIPYPVGPQKKVVLLLDKKEKEAAAAKAEPAKKEPGKEPAREPAKPEPAEPEAQKDDKGRDARNKNNKKENKKDRNRRREAQNHKKDEAPQEPVTEKEPEAKPEPKPDLGPEPIKTKKAPAKARTELSKEKAESGRNHPAPGKTQPAPEPAPVEPEPAAPAPAVQNPAPAAEAPEPAEPAAPASQTIVGRINIVDSFYNFTPMGVWNEGQYRALSPEEIDALIPRAEQYKNINLWYSLHSDQKFMEEHFHENDIVFLDLSSDDLVENKDSQGNLRSTAYRVFCIDALKAGKLRFPYEEGLYALVEEKQLLDPLATDTVLRLQEPNLFVGQQLLLHLENGWIAGPYEVQRNVRFGFYLESDVPENQYLLTACPPEAWQAETFYPAEGTWASRQEKTEWVFYHRLAGTQSQLVDLATDEVLVRSLVNCCRVEDGDLVKPADLKAFLQREEDRLFTGLPTAIRKQRLDRLEAILEGDDTARDSYKAVGDFLYQHLLENLNKRWSQDFITALVERVPDLWQQLGSAKNLSSRNRRAIAQVQERQARLAQPQSEEELAQRINALPAAGSNNRKCLDYLVEAIQKERPQYSRNLIMNLLLCTTQGFLTVFSGAPGSGKTSFCNLLGKVLGLTQFDRKIGDQDFMSTTNRYIPVSVERGWTSKRDLIGYYNPLNKTFEESNRDVYDGLRLLDWEKRHGVRQYPYYILLDEANLSPMEYYWADFMNVCDDWNEEHTINLGHNHRFQLPETLHFLATINNDHTTETLSPRLIDRAWIITLPHTDFVPEVGRGLGTGEIQQISWPQLKSLFDVAPRESCALTSVEQNVYDRVKARLAEQNIYLSMRIELAIHRYWRAASRLMEPDDHIRPGIIALDFAVAQKILPKLSGNGADYEKWLVQFRDDCASNKLVQSAALLDQILEWGNRRMKFFQFFH
ncbi:MAG: hypothetical protein ACI3X3_05495 [Acidaminococcus sp.]|uniref:hypothetical protein n=1 Tax=Acidaminococcus sp. TaxID=1872103 RepID=UPI003F16E2C6